MTNTPLTDNLFAEDTSPAFNAGLVSSLEAGYCARILSNPPTPAFMEANPRRESFARFAAKKDIARFFAVLGDLGLTITPESTITRKEAP